jgi:Phage integrase family.
MARPEKGPYLQQRNGVWQLIHRAAGIRRSLGTNNEAEAQRLLEEYILAATGFTPPTDPTIADLMTAYRIVKRDEMRESARRTAIAKARRSGDDEQEAIGAAVSEFDDKKHLGTVDYAITDIKRIIGKHRVAMIGNAVAIHYRDTRRSEDLKSRGEGKVGDGTIHRELTYLKAAINWAWNDDKATWFSGGAKNDFTMPVREGESAPRWFTHDEIGDLVRRCKSPHLRLYIMIAVNTGARTEAILSLTWDDVDWGNGIIDFGRVDHKKRRPRVRISSTLRPYLDAAYLNRTCDHVIEYRGGPIDTIKSGWGDLMVEIGREEMTPRNLKHTYISWLVMSGKLTYEAIANLANTTVGTLQRHYSALHPGVADDVDDALAIDGLIDGVRSATPKPTREELESGDQLARNVVPLRNRRK